MEGLLEVLEPSVIINPAEHDPRDVYKILIGSIVPRPIAFVSTLSTEGVRNLAPFSFFNAVCAAPPVISISISYRAAEKDTLRNIRETREFVVNIVSDEFSEQMNLTSGEYAPEVDEFEVSGLTPVASELVRPPRVKESRVQMECRLHQIVPVSDRPMGATLVLGQVARFHVDDAIVDNFRIDPAKLNAIGRMGGNGYARTTNRFEMVRPVVK